MSNRCNEAPVGLVKTVSRLSHSLRLFLPNALSLHPSFHRYQVCIAALPTASPPVISSRRFVLSKPLVPLVLSGHLCFGGQEPKVWKSSSCQTIRISKECDCKSWSKKTARPVRLTWVLHSSLLNHKLPRGTREKISCTLSF